MGVTKLYERNTIKGIHKPTQRPERKGNYENT